MNEEAVSMLPAFTKSAALTLGIELELQIIGGQDYDLIGAAPDLLREIAGRRHPGEVKPEIVDSMIELSTDICRDYDDALGQLRHRHRRGDQPAPEVPEQAAPPSRFDDGSVDGKGAQFGQRAPDIL